MVHRVLAALLWLVAVVAGVAVAALSHTLSSPVRGGVPLLLRPPAVWAILLLLAVALAVALAWRRQTGDS